MAQPVPTGPAPPLDEIVALPLPFTSSRLDSSSAVVVKPMRLIRDAGAVVVDCALPLVEELAGCVVPPGVVVVPVVVVEGAGVEVGD